MQASKELPKEVLPAAAERKEKKIRPKMSFQAPLLPATPPPPLLPLNHHQLHVRIHLTQIQTKQWIIDELNNVFM